MMVNNSNKTRYLTLFRFELPSFDGQIKNWIGVQAQFKKFNDNTDLDDDKMHYLLQSMKKVSVARDGGEFSIIWK